MTAYLRPWQNQPTTELSEMRDDNSRDQKKILQWPLLWVIPSKDGQLFSVFHWSLQAATSKAEKSEQPLASYPPSDSWRSGRVVDNTKKVHHLKTAYHISQQTFFKVLYSSSQPSRISILHEIIYFILQIGEAFGVGSMPSWRPFWALNIPNSLRIGHLRWLCFLPMIGSLQHSKLPWPGHNFQSWKLCSALSISKRSFAI